MLDLDSTVISAGMDAFGEMIAWTPAGGALQTVPAIFWDNAIDTKFQDGAEVDEITTYLSVRLSQMTGMPAQGDAMTVRGLAYVVTETHPDGVGGARVRIRLLNDAQLAVAPTPPVPVAP
jgi:hypothetical protein